MSQLTPRANQAVATVQQILTENLPKIKSVLPAHMDARRLARVALTTCERTPALLECSASSLALSFINAAELGLEPGITGEAYMVPYGKTCTLIIGYKGMMKLARNTGVVKNFQVGVVREGDEIYWERGKEPTLRHVEKLDNDKAEITHFWASALVEGDFVFDIMTKAQVDAIKRRSRSGNSGPWSTDYEEMGKKTVIRRLWKMLPISTDGEAARKLAKAVVLDENADANLPQHNDFVDLGAAEEVAPSAADKVREKLGSPEPVEAEDAEVVEG